MIKRVIQVAFAPENFTESIQSYLDLGFEKVKEFEKDNGKARAVLLRLGDFHFELWDCDPGSELFGISDHIGLEVGDLENEIERLESCGFEIVRPIATGTTVKRYAFVKNKDGKIFELIEK